MSMRSELAAQLNALLRLTHTEIMIAESRRAQAATSDVERELATNADKARERSRMLTESIRKLGGLPDVVGIGTGRLAANAKSLADQGQALVDALLGDLALENQLLARTRFAMMLAERAGNRDVIRTLERLETAHGATVEWLQVRLGELAVGGPVALRPTPGQSVAGVVRQLSLLPVRQGAGLVNRSVDTAGRLRRGAAETASTNVQRIRQMIDAAVQIWTAGRDASLKRS